MGFALPGVRCCGQAQAQGSAGAELELGRQIVKLIRDGNYPGPACRLVGIRKAVLDKWLERGEKGEQPFADFLEAYQQAEAQCETRHVGQFNQAGAEDWRASKDFLARRWPERWSERRFEPPGNLLLGMGFQISIHLEDSPEEEAQRLKVQRNREQAALTARTVETEGKPIAIEETKELPPEGKPRN